MPYLYHYNNFKHYSNTATLSCGYRRPRKSKITEKKLYNNSNKVYTMYLKLGKQTLKQL